MPSTPNARQIGEVIMSEEVCQRCNGTAKEPAPIPIDPNKPKGIIGLLSNPLFYAQLVIILPLIGGFFHLDNKAAVNRENIATLDVKANTISAETETAKKSAATAIEGTKTNQVAIEATKEETKEIKADTKEIKADIKAIAPKSGSKKP